MTILTTVRFSWFIAVLLLVLEEKIVVLEMIIIT